MPTQAQLEAEIWWAQEMEAPAHARFNGRLRAHYGHTRSQTGSKGDVNHLRGRHRSRDWDLNSRWCTDRAYATRDARDKAGVGRWLRATDIGIQGPDLWAASRRLDAAVRAGRLPCVAEWFGSLDGLHVIGWYQGHPSTSDVSHTWHLHVGIWTKYCDDEEQLALLYAVITGEDDDMPLTTDDLKAVRAQTALGVYDALKMAATRSDPTGRQLGDMFAGLVSGALKAQLDAILKAAEDDGDTTVVLPPEGIALFTEIRDRVAALPDTAELRDAVADLGEGGAAAVRADAD
jgi:hypothetical protein